jgi:predicted aspartyl protease
LAPEDYLGMTKVVLASGAQTEAKLVRIRTLKVGEVKVSDVVAVIGTKDAPTLLGQTFLRKFRSWSIDNHKHTLNLE